jgi:hypothetical protein
MACPLVDSCAKPLLNWPELLAVYSSDTLLRIMIVYRR